MKISFSHVHLYVDSLDNVKAYKDVEERLNAFAKVRESAPHNGNADIQALSYVWHSMMHDSESPQMTTTTNQDSFCPQNRDIVKQLIVGLGFRVTGARFPSKADAVITNTKSVLLTSTDPDGVQFVITSPLEDYYVYVRDKYSHFDVENLKVFFDCHNQRQGVAVLGFQVDSMQEILAKYLKHHPRLIHDTHVYDYAKILEVFAYYKDDSSKGAVDKGTMLRFVEYKIPDRAKKGDEECCVLPGLVPLEAIFDERYCQPAYCDHWVSNVFSRTGFLDTLETTLGFTPKVDFNAGVVAAGEAQIESTVTGNESDSRPSDKDMALRDQTQVYLPINNALSDVGHVHGFLKEIGQGIQHIASRVENLLEFVQHANDMREITGEGFTFLNIPRSYYGILSSSMLINAGLSCSAANALMSLCQSQQVISSDGAVDLDLDRDEIDGRLTNILNDNDNDTVLQEYTVNKDKVLQAILDSRYCNLKALLQDHVSEASYLGIVRNQILVDVQGDDLLYQIFTCNILQRKAGDEAPFLEFIQRVCSECKDETTGCPAKIKPGCGGFGIRNFLTLFLSIEVSKAMMQVSEARRSGDQEGLEYAERVVACFTDQLNEANPILTEISYAMTKEGRCKEQLQEALDKKDDESAAEWRIGLEQASRAKAAGNENLMECSSKYKALMKELRDERP